ncbi:hypothetical protein pb186bvf_013628 [Paramecium bursaria]
MNQVLNVQFIAFQSQEMIDFYESIQSVELIEDYIEYFNRREIKVKAIKNETNFISLYFQSLDNNPNQRKAEFYLDENEVCEQLMNFGQITFYFVDENNLNFSHNGRYYSRESRLLRLICFAEVKHLFIVSKNPGAMKTFIDEQLMQQYLLIERLELQKIQTIKHISFDNVMDEIKKLKPIQVKELQLDCVFRIFGLRNKFIMVEVLKGILLPEVQLYFDRQDQGEKRKVIDIWLSGIKELHNQIVAPNQYAIVLMDKFAANLHIKGSLGYDYRLRPTPPVPDRNQLQGMIQCPNEQKKLDFHTDNKKIFSDCIIGNGKVQKTVTTASLELDELKKEILDQKIDLYKPYNLYQIKIALPSRCIGYSTHDQYPQISKILNCAQGLESQYYGKITKIQGPINITKPNVAKQFVLAYKQDQKQTLNQLQPGVPLNGKKFYKCRLCKEQGINSIIIPCGHYRYCNECVGEQQQCLFCDQPIKDKITLPLAGLDEKIYKLNKIQLNEIIDRLLGDQKSKLDFQVCLDWIKLYLSGQFQLHLVDKCECNKYLKAYGYCALKHMTYMCKECFKQNKIVKCKDCQQGFIEKNMINCNFHE